MTFRILPHALIVMAVLVSAGIGPSEAADTPQQLRTACDKGDATACGSLGFMYAQGNGVLQDDLRAATLFWKACDGGYMPSCAPLGLMYEGGAGVSQDAFQAGTLYRKACDGGDTLGCHHLARMYVRGTGVPQDDVQAAALFRKACDGDYIPSCAPLGAMYITGRGVKLDNVQAVALYRKVLSWHSTEIERKKSLRRKRCSQSCIEHGLRQSRFWMTFWQALALNAHVGKGEKGFSCIAHFITCKETMS